jgi:hypothetical protein
MLKNLKIIFVFIIVVIFGLVGCIKNSSNDDKSRFIGEWFGTYNDSINKIKYEIIFNFYDNNTAQNIYYWYNESNVRELIYTLWRNYTIENSKLCLTYLTNTSFTRCYEYTFYNDYSNLKISSINDSEEYYFTKVTNK